MQETILRGGGKLELKQTAFSHSCYLVTVSGIPDFLLSLWDFEQGLLLCQVPLNGIYLTTISFCPLNWRWIVATDARYFYFWQVESCNQITLLRCKYMRLPEQSVPLGVYEDPVQKGITCPDQVPDRTRFDPNLPTSAVSGVGEAKQMEFEDYLDNADHIFCVSQTWSNTDLVFIGCKNGELLLVDPNAMTMKVLLNPLTNKSLKKNHTDSTPETRSVAVTAEAMQSAEVTETSENEVDSLAIPPGAFHFLLYTKFGLLCAGRDGLLRILRVNSRMIEMPVHTKGTDSAPVSNNYPQLLRREITSCKILYKFPNPFHENQGQSPPSITGLCVSPSFGRLLLGSRSGQIVLLNISCDLWALEGSLNPEYELLTNNDSFVGLGILGPERTKVCVTARRSGVVNTWDCETGRLLGSLAVGEQCCGVAVSPVIPVAAVGTRSGVLLMLDCSEPTTLRVVESIKLFHNPLSHLEFDAEGDLLIAAADDEYSVALSGRPKNKFEPLGFVPITGKVNDLTVMRHGPKTIFVLVTTGVTAAAAATEVYFYELTLAMLYNSQHFVVDSCLGLRADTIRLMQLHFNIPTISVCLWPPRDDSVSAPPTLFAIDSRGKQLLTYVLPEEPISRPAHNLSSYSRAVSSGRPAGSSNVHLGHTGSGTFAISGRHDHSRHVGTSFLRHNGRKAKATSAFTLRLTPGPIQTISTVDGQDNTEDTTQHSQKASGLNPLTISAMLRGTGRVKLTRVGETNCLLALYGDGVVELLEVSANEVVVKQTIGIHESDHIGVSGAEFCGDFRSLITCGCDGLLTRTEITLDSDSQPESVYKATTEMLERASQDSKLLAKLPTHVPKQKVLSANELDGQNQVTGQTSGHNADRPLFYRSSTAMSMAEHSMTLSSSAQSNSEPVEVFPVLSEPDRSTWLETCEKESHAVEDQIYDEARQQVRSELAEIKHLINAMAEENEELPEIQRIGRQEFELDVDEQAAIMEDTEKEVKQTRQEIQLSDLANQFTWHVLKNRCWDEMRVKGRILRAFGSQLEVCNFPLRSRSREELDRLNAVRTRRTIQVQLAGMFSRMNESGYGASDTRPMLPAGQNEEPDEDEEEEVVINRVLAGSIAMDWGGPSELCYSQLDLYTREQKIYQVVLVEDNIFQIKEAFNKRFDEVYQKKDSGLQKIRTRLERIRKILVDIQQPNAAKSVIDPAFSPEEQPEMLLTVNDSEITAERYLSPAEVAELERRRLAEEERRRREMLDNWRERGLEEMMGGVLEVRKEDELKKDVPKPAFLITGKPLVHWTADDRRLYAEYERKVQELNEEREKYRKFLEGEMKTLYAAIDEERVKFDEQIVALFNDWIRVQIAVVHEELKIWRLKWMLLVEEELFVHENELRQQLDKTDQEREVLGSLLLSPLIVRTLESAKEVLEQEKGRYDLLCAEDKLLEKNFRKEFADVHGPLYDYIAKAFRRRPKRVGPISSTHIESDTAENSEAILCAAVYNPYSERVAHRRILGFTKKDLEECFRELDNDPAREGQPPLDNAVWERLCKYRRRKFEKEMEVKNNALKLADIHAFVQRREEELHAVRTHRETLVNDLNSSLKDYHRNQTDLELQLLVKQGQVEVDLVEGNLVRDYSDALLINRDQVEELNAHIIKFGEYKVAHLIRNKEFKRRFYHLEWELRRMLMQYEDVQTKLNDIRKFKITREVQKYLQTNDYDGMINAQVITLEHTMNLMRQTHAKAMEQKRRRLRRYQEVQGDKLKAENEKLKTDLKELNVELHETKFIHDQNRCVGTKRSTGPPRYKLLVQQQRLMQLASEQAKEIKSLRKQLTQLQEQKKLLQSSGN
ncbi:Cilia- and flagella-associated protein 43 [Clonorchis sinensis]|nr:Cilia- and flagella-associated protein 43 [Clonorchis sinensis]